jgi:hypothetical protein
MITTRAIAETWLCHYPGAPCRLAYRRSTALST